MIKGEKEPSYLPSSPGARLAGIVALTLPRRKWIQTGEFLWPVSPG